MLLLHLSAESPLQTEFISDVLNAGKWSNPEPWLESKEGVCFKLAISRVFFFSESVI